MCGVGWHANQRKMRGCLSRRCNEPGYDDDDVFIITIFSRFDFFFSIFHAYQPDLSIAFLGLYYGGYGECTTESQASWHKAVEERQSGRHRVVLVSEVWHIPPSPMDVIFFLSWSKINNVSQVYSRRQYASCE